MRTWEVEGGQMINKLWDWLFIAEKTRIGQEIARPENGKKLLMWQAWRPCRDKTKVECIANSYEFLAWWHIKNETNLRKDSDYRWRHFRPEPRWTFLCNYVMTWWSSEPSPVYELCFGRFSEQFLHVKDHPYAIGAIWCHSNTSHSKP